MSTPGSRDPLPDAIHSAESALEVYGEDGARLVPSRLSTTPGPIEEFGCTCPPDECHAAGSEGCYFGAVYPPDQEDQ